jgi:hypothetical protein
LTAAAASHLLFDADGLFVLGDDPGNALGVLGSLIETLALALIKRPGPCEAGRCGCLHGQSEYERAD